MSLKLYRPDPDGGQEPSPVEVKDYRSRLRSRRWESAALSNPEVDKTNPWLGVLFIGGIVALTFVVLVAGYWSSFWG